MMRNIQNNQQGAAALLTVIIVSAAVLVMAFSAAILGLGELEMAYTSQRGGETLAIAEGCADEALRQLRLDDAYSGASLNLGSGSCTIIVIGSNPNRTVTTVANINSQYYKIIQVDLTLSGANNDIIILTSWKELSS